MDNDNLCVKRKRKTNILDDVLYRLHYSQLGKSQELVTQYLNLIKYNLKLTNNITRQAYSSRDSNIPVSFYESFYNKLSKFIDDNIYKTNNSCEIFAVDGTDIGLLQTDNLLNNKFKPNKEKSITALNIGIYNITRFSPYIIDTVNHKNEIKSFMDITSKHNIMNNNIFVLDRGFASDEIFYYFNKNNSFFVCRIKNNSKLSIGPSNDYITKTNSNMDIRIIKYTINNNNYIIATNLMNCNYQIIKDLYFKRWTVEEYFKYVKANFNFSHINETKLTSIQKTIYSQLIITKIVSVITYLYNKYNKIKSIYTINKRTLVNGLFNSLLTKIFYCKLNKNTLKDIFEIIITITHTKHW
jgi:hypothetical protein